MKTKSVCCRAVCALAAVLVLVLLTGCGKRSVLGEKELLQNLPWDLLAYTLDGQEFYSEPVEMTIDRRNTDGEIDEVECTITLEDAQFVRTEYVMLELVYYEQGGWQVTDWYRITDGTAEARGGPSPEICENALERFGYRGITRDHDEETGMNSYETYYTVNDEYAFVSFQGTVKVSAELYVMAVNSEPAALWWELEADKSGVQAHWADVTGTWKGTSKKSLSYSGVHGTFEITISELKENGWCEGSGHYWWPGARPGEEETLQVYDYEDASWKQSGNCPAEAEFVISIQIGSYGKLVFTAEGVTMNIDGKWYKDLTNTTTGYVVSDKTEEVDLSGVEPGQSAFSSLGLSTDNYHYLGSTYSEICEWHHGESDNYGFMEAAGCYYTSLTRNADLEMRKADGEDVLQPDDYCFGISGWFSRIFDVQRDGPVTVADVVSYFNARNAHTMDVTDEVEAPTNLGPDTLLCMDIELDTAGGPRKVRLELEASDLQSHISDDTWARIYLLEN